MRRRHLGGLMLSALGAAALASTGALAAPRGAQVPRPLDDSERRNPDEKPDAGPCLTSRAQARYSGYGYDHLVELDNACKQDQRCHITTSSNPKGVDIDVPRGDTRTVIAFRGSPAREFDHDVDCTAK